MLHISGNGLQRDASDVTAATNDAAALRGTHASFGTFDAAKSAPMTYPPFYDVPPTTAAATDAAVLRNAITSMGAAADAST